MSVVGSATFVEGPFVKVARTVLGSCCAVTYMVMVRVIVEVIVIVRSRRSTPGAPSATRALTSVKNVIKFIMEKKIAHSKGECNRKYKGVSLRKVC